LLPVRHQSNQRLGGKALLFNRRTPQAANKTRIKTSQSKEKGSESDGESVNKLITTRMDEIRSHLSRKNASPLKSRTFLKVPQRESKTYSLMMLEHRSQYNILNEVLQETKQPSSNNNSRRV